MIAAHPRDALVLIPGAYEPASGPHRDTGAHMVATTPLRDLRARTASAALPYVIAAPAGPTTRLGRAAAILGDVALVIVIVFLVALAPVLVVQGINAIAAPILDTSAQ